MSHPHEAPMLATPAATHGQPAWRVERQTQASRVAAAVALALLVLAASMPWWADSAWMREFVEIGCYFIFAAMWNLLAGYGGMVSIGQQGFFGVGGYVMLALGNFAGFNPFVAVPVAALAAGCWPGRSRRSPSGCRAATSRSALG